MKRSGCVAGGSTLAASLLLLAAVSAVTAQEAVEEGIEAKWYVSPFAGALNFEGDAAVKDGAILGARLGYDYSEDWSFEGGLLYAPSLKENFRTQFVPGEEPRVRSRLADDIEGNAGVTETSSAEAFFDALYHFTRWERPDPYLTLGTGVQFHEHDLGSGKVEPAMRVGGGFMYHINDEWALRIDGRAYVAGKDTEASATIDGGVVWTWGARVKPVVRPVGPLSDRDADGLPDVEEPKYNCDPDNPDSDQDGLFDGEEVYTYRTDPMNPDTDFDMLKDGEEVKRHKTDPLKADTDDGGVTDGHEVLEDSTNPLDGSDDLVLYELYINFDTDMAIIKPQYDAQLQKIIAKMLKRYPASEVKIEGHADRRRHSKAEYNQKLSERRAKAVLDYFAQRGGIERNRMRAAGFGFSRPKAPNDPVSGNLLNRRVDVYIKRNELPKEGDLHPSELGPPPEAPKPVHEPRMPPPPPARVQPGVSVPIEDLK
jgi:outer membrane protein OmpA-like peptidoglycan-associated protein/opacity protein-like surface antigen